MSSVTAGPLGAPDAPLPPPLAEPVPGQPGAEIVGEVGARAIGAPDEGGVWAPGRRRLTAALVLTITLVAFESLAIATVMPVVSDDLGGLGLYGWVFSGFFLGSLLGIVLAGWAADRRGTRLPFAVGLSLFAVGLVVGGTAPTMGIPWWAGCCRGPVPV